MGNPTQNPALVNTTTAPTADVQNSTFISLLLSSLVYLFRLTAGAFGAVAEILESTSSRPARVELSPLTFRHERDAVKLQQIALFVSLLTDIRSHLLLSKSTRSVYVSMAEQFLLASRAEGQQVFIKPTDRDFYEYVFSHWPTFSSFKAPTSDEITWAWVEKGPLEPNEVNLLSSIVESAESTATACDPHRLPLDLYKLVITTVILHEISHAFTKFYFNETATPLGFDTGEKSGYGELGWLVDEELMGGRLAVEWNDESKFGDMDAINRLVLISGPESWVVNVDVATKVISSLRGSMLNWPAKSTLTPHVPSSGSVRAWLTESTDNPVPSTKTTSIGWGSNIGPLTSPVLSFIGYDRKV